MAKGKVGCSGLLLFLSTIWFCYFGVVKTECYQSSGYEVTETKYSCRIHQRNWATEAIFLMTYKHCLQEPTVNLFIRNFHGIDEINNDFNKRFSSWKTQLFSGKTSMLSLKFKVEKADGKYTKKSMVHVTLIYVPIFGRLDTQQLLTAVFPLGDKSDCLWGETLEIHDQAFFGGGLCLAFILIIVSVICYRKQKATNYRPALTEKVYL